MFGCQSAQAVYGTQFFVQEIQGVSSVQPCKCVIKCLAENPHQFLWAICPQPILQAQSLKVADPNLSDPAIRVMGADNRTKRKRTDKESQKALNLWQKYGSKVVHQGELMVKRSYYKCFMKDCLAKLQVDTEHENAGVQLKTTALGVITLAHLSPCDSVACSTMLHFSCSTALHYVRPVVCDLHCRGAFNSSRCI